VESPKGSLGGGSPGEGSLGHDSFLDFLYGNKNVLFQRLGKVGITFWSFFGTFDENMEKRTCILKALDGFGPPSLSKMATKVNLHIGIYEDLCMCTVLLGFPRNPSNTP